MTKKYSVVLLGSATNATQDYNALLALLDHPSQHLWVTFQDSCLWWCTARDGVHINPSGESKDEGHFWLECEKSWSCESLGGRLLSIANLPGAVAATAGFRATVCKPKASREILGLVRDERHSDARAALEAREAYCRAIAKLISRLSDKDFELLIELILSRTGWERTGKIGRVKEGTDIEAENVSTNECAFVQIKSVASQVVFNGYLKKFSERRQQFHRMIFAVHTPKTTLTPPSGQPVQIWAGDYISQLVVRLGLGEWVANRI